MCPTIKQARVLRTAGLTVGRGGGVGGSLSPDAVPITSPQSNIVTEKGKFKWEDIWWTGVGRGGLLERGAIAGGRKITALVIPFSPKK